MSSSNAREPYENATIQNVLNPKELDDLPTTEEVIGPDESPIYFVEDRDFVGELRAVTGYTYNLASNMAIQGEYDVSDEQNFQEDALRKLSAAKEEFMDYPGENPVFVNDDLFEYLDEGYLPGQMRFKVDSTNYPVRIHPMSELNERIDDSEALDASLGEKAKEKSVNNYFIAPVLTYNDSQGLVSTVPATVAFDENAPLVMPEGHDETLFRDESGLGADEPILEEGEELIANPDEYELIEADEEDHGDYWLQIEGVDDTMDVDSVEGVERDQNTIFIEEDNFEGRIISESLSLDVYSAVLEEET